jgi:hypothetical protein
MISYLGTIGSNYYFNIPEGSENLYWSGVNETRDGSGGLRFLLTPISAPPEGVRFHDSWRIVSSTDSQIITAWDGKNYSASYTLTPQPDGKVLFSSTVGTEITGQASTSPVLTASNGTPTNGNTAAPGPTSVSIVTVLGIALTLWWVLK